MSRDRRILDAAAELRRARSRASDARIAVLGRVWAHPDDSDYHEACRAAERAQHELNEAARRVLAAACSVEDGHADGPGA